MPRSPRRFARAIKTYQSFLTYSNSIPLYIFQIVKLGLRHLGRLARGNLTGYSILTCVRRSTKDCRSFSTILNTTNSLRRLSVTPKSMATTSRFSRQVSPNLAPLTYSILSTIPVMGSLREIWQK